jgi:hypothetical protein
MKTNIWDVAAFVIEAGLVLLGTCILASAFLGGLL